MSSKYRFCRLFALASVLLLCANTYAEGAFPANAGFRHANLVPFCDYLNEDDAELSLEEVQAASASARFSPLQSDTVNFGLRRAASWFRFTVSNPGSARATYYVELSNARIKRADLYAPGQDPGTAHQQAGTGMPFAERTLPYRNPVFRLELAPGQEQTVFLRVFHRGSYRFRLLLWEYDAFIAQHTLLTILYGMYYGALCIMFVFNLCLFGLFRDRSFFLLSGVIACVGLYMAVYQRLDTQFLWPDYPNLPGSRLNVLIGLGLCAAFLFSRNLLATASHASRCDRVLRIYAILCLALCLDVVVGGLWTDVLLQLIGGTTPIVLMTCAVVRVRQGHRYAWGYLVTWGVMFASMIGFALMGAGILPQYFIIEHGPKIAFPLALALNSITIWQRFRALQDEHTANLEIQVKERTRELTEALDKVKTLHGLIPICSACKNIRNDEGFWIRVETYIRERSDADFTHGICPDCAKRLYDRDIGHLTQKTTP